MKRRVEEVLFPRKAPYGYRNIRVEKRGLVEVHHVNGTKVTKLFGLYAYHHLTLYSPQERLYQDGIYYNDSVCCFPRSKLFAIFRDRS